MSSLFRKKNLGKKQKKQKTQAVTTDKPELSITVPIPKFDANKRGKNYRWESSRRKTDRRRSRRACHRALDALSTIRRKKLGIPWNSAKLVVRWYHPTKRHRDPWNIIGCLKGTLDGIVDAGIIKDDDQIAPPEIDFQTDAEKPRVEIDIFRLDAE